MSHELTEIYTRLHNNHNKQVVDLAVLRILTSSLIKNYAKQSGHDVDDQLALLLNVIDTNAKSLGDINGAVKAVRQSADTANYLATVDAVAAKELITTTRSLLRRHSTLCGELTAERKRTTELIADSRRLRGC